MVPCTVAWQMIGMSLEIASNTPEQNSITLTAHHHPTPSPHHSTASPPPDHTTLTTPPTSPTHQPTNPPLPPSETSTTPQSHHTTGTDLIEHKRCGCNWVAWGVVCVGDLSLTNRMLRQFRSTEYQWREGLDKQETRQFSR